VAQSVFDTGWVSDEDLPLWLAASDVLVLPLREDLRNRGRWPHKLGDMAAAERAVIVSKAGEFPERLIYDGGALAADWSPTSFATAIGRLLEDKEFRSGVAKRGRQFALRELDWAPIGDSLARLVQCTVG
jgi:glycosyltransferase involved in cell wall biosynthesis